MHFTLNNTVSNTLVVCTPYAKTTQNAYYWQTLVVILISNKITFGTYHLAHVMYYRI